MTDNAVVPIEQARDQKRSQALLKAIGLDRVPLEQREIALHIAKRYELDLLLKHLVLVDGRPYITRDGLLHVAHRSGALDGIEVTDPELVDMPGVGQFWRAKASVYRKDMSRAFTYQGRYPAKGGNQRFAPEMAVKVAEVMALRRAFDVSAPVIEERWDIDTQVPADDTTQTVTERIAAKRAALTRSAPEMDDGRAGQGDSEAPAAAAPAVIPVSAPGSTVRGRTADETGTKAAPHAGPAADAGIAVAAVDATSQGQPPDAEPPPGAPPEDAAAGVPVAPVAPSDEDEEAKARPPRCQEFHALNGKCVREAGHEAKTHRNRDGETWA
jgi:hypothetical protein